MRRGQRLFYKTSGSTNLEVLRNFTDKALEGQLADEELRRLLVATDFTEGDGTRPETMGLLDTTSGGLNEQLDMEEGLSNANEQTWTDLRAACLVASCLRGALPPVL